MLAGGSGFLRKTLHRLGAPGKSDIQCFSNAYDPPFYGLANRDDPLVAAVTVKVIP